MMDQTPPPANNNSNDDTHEEITTSTATSSSCASNDDSADIVTTSNDDLLLNTAIVYESFKEPSKGCCHSVPFDNIIQLVHNASSTSTKITCPICGINISYIEDGCLSSHNNNESFSYITFMYGKIIYRLSIIEYDEQNESNESKHWFYIYFWNTTNDKITKTNKMKMMTAQERIANVLGFDYENSMKILSKGKVIYPTNTTMDKYDISKMLIQYSIQQTLYGRVNFVVMGTCVDTQQKLLNQEKQKQNKRHLLSSSIIDNNSNNNSIMKKLYQFMSIIIHYGIETIRISLILSVQIIYYIGSTTYHYIICPLFGVRQPNNNNNQMNNRRQ